MDECDLPVRYLRVPVHSLSGDSIVVRVLVLVQHRVRYGRRESGLMRNCARAMPTYFNSIIEGKTLSGYFQVKEGCRLIFSGASFCDIITACRRKICGSSRSYTYAYEGSKAALSSTRFGAVVRWRRIGLLEEATAGESLVFWPGTIFILARNEFHCFCGNSLAQKSAFFSGHGRRSSQAPHARVVTERPVSVYPAGA